MARAGAGWSFLRGGWRGRKGQGLGCQGGLVKAAAEYLRRGDGLLGQAGDLRERVLARRRPGNEIEVLAVEAGQSQGAELVLLSRICSLHLYGIAFQRADSRCGSIPRQRESTLLRAQHGGRHGARPVGCGAGCKLGAQPRDRAGNGTPSGNQCTPLGGYLKSISENPWRGGGSAS